MAVTNLGAESRLAAIEVLLLWEGRVSNARLREFFPIHASQASRDLAAYRQRVPDNVALGFSYREYAVTPYARAVLTRGVFDDYAALIGAPAPRALRGSVPMEVEQVTLSQPSDHVYRTLHDAISVGGGVEIQYASMTHPAPHDRAIFPHAVVFAAPRWHVRAWCVLRKDFRDFNLGRIRAAVAITDVSPRRAADDRWWNETVSVQLVPHQELSPQQRLVVRQEYMGGTVALVQTRRVALVPYLLQAYRAAIDPRRDQPPEFLLQVSNPDLLPREAVWGIADQAKEMLGAD